MSLQNIVSMLGIEDPVELDKLFEEAYETKLKYVGNKVYLRGLIEFSNICDKNCYYCGIRRDSSSVNRYEMSKQEAVEEGLWAFKNRYGSVVIQAGERTDRTFISTITEIIKELREKSDGWLGITLSLGEQERETYEEWFATGAHRYLLRVETTNKELYKKCHPQSQSFEKRVEALNILKETGYQVGTGVMIGLPGQTLEDLANDILFFKEFDIDMIGMGPYIVHSDTPFSKIRNLNKPEDNLVLGLKMIAATRLTLKDVNIASTTALQTLAPDGREMGLKAGANVIMPNVTETKYREFYSLYNDKPNTDENAETARVSLEKSIETIGETIGYEEWGDSPHFFKRTNA
ncbi:MAG: [FeFe] hydrogenase H-cluster radical SAM maturase HydE [Candidatus Cloacimonas sp.]